MSGCICPDTECNIINVAVPDDIMVVKKKKKKLISTEI